MRIAEMPPADWFCLDLDAALELVLGSVSKYPRFQYSGKALIRAGKVIASDLPWNEENELKIRNAFRIAHSWRNSHAYPMKSIRSQIIWHMHKNGIEGFTAARLKRMPAIKRKLKRETFSLHMNQLQDLGGVRVVLPSMADVIIVSEILNGRSRHELREADDYIANPKADGYRSHHLMYNFRDKRFGGLHDGRRIEVQIRTRLQHAWATAVEAVGLFRGEDLKGGQGSSDWLRLFHLMSAEFAMAERCAIPLSVPDQPERIAEIRSLNDKLDAAGVLESLSHIVKWVDENVQSASDATHYLIRYNHAEKEVRVMPHLAAIVAAESYEQMELQSLRTERENETIVMVEVDKVSKLREAYPNYFGDVQLFRMQLVDITKGKGATEYTLPPRITPPPPNRENPDLSWFRQPRFRKPKGA